MWSTLLTLWLTHPAPAEARPGPTAEVQRLLNEAEDLAARGAWTGVDRVYRQLEALQADGAELPLQAHLLGAQASRQLGLVMDQYHRLEAAERVESTEEARRAIGHLYANYGLVSLEAARSFKAPLVLEALDLGFAPEMRTTVEAARAALRAERRYEGLLPLGRYVLSGRPFGVDGSTLSVRLVKADLANAPKEDPAPAAPEAPAAPSAPAPGAEAPTTTRTTFLLMPSVPVEAATWASAGEALKQDLLGLVEVVEVRIWGVEPCVKLTGSPGSTSWTDLRAPTAKAFSLTEPQVRPSEDGLYLSLDPGKLPGDWSSFRLEGQPKPLGEWATIAASWCDAVAVRRLEVVVESGVLLSEVRGDLADVLSSHPGAVTLGLQVP